MNAPRLLVTPVLVALLAGCAAAPRRETFHLNADVERGIGYAQAVRDGDTLYVSGTVGRGEDMETQVQSAYAAIDRTLRHFGVGPEAIVREVVYTTDIEAFKEATGPRRAFYGSHVPAATWVGVQRLYVPTLKVEIEVTARLPR